MFNRIKCDFAISCLLQTTVPFRDCLIDTTNLSFIFYIEQLICVAYPRYGLLLQSFFEINGLIVIGNTIELYVSCFQSYY